MGPLLEWEDQHRQVASLDSRQEDFQGAHPLVSQDAEDHLEADHVSIEVVQTIKSVG